MNLNLSLHNKQVLSQKMRLSVKVLQFNSHDLEQYIKNEALENPIIELDEPKAQEDSKIERLKKLEWLDSMDESKFYRYSHNYDHEEADSPIGENRQIDTLSDELFSQIPSFHLDDETERVLRYLIYNLDDNGYLPAIHESSGDISQNAFDKALHILQRMDPPGVGASDLRECLLIQAKRQVPPSAALIEIIDKYLDLLAKNQLDKISKVMNISIHDVKCARSALLLLNPKPGNGYSTYNAFQYIKPDLFIIQFEDAFQIIYNDYSQPQITISDYYRSLAKDGNAEVKKYVNDKLDRVEWMISCIDNRKKTILRCAEKILSWQIRFFESGPGFIVPMTLSDIASQLGVHPSTVSRTVSGKYLQCQWGVFGLGAFFSRNISDKNENQSQDALIAELKRVIENENKAKPFSDEQLTEELKKAGIVIARRTVAKYREQLRIPAAGQRKEY